MSKFSAYAQLFLVPGRGALGFAPVMLFSTAEILPAILLIGIPITFYILCTPLLGERLFKQNM